MSEYGFIAYPEMASLKRFIPDWDMRADSPSILAHHRAYDDVTRDPEFSNKMIGRYMSRYAWVPEDFEEYVYMTQWFQAEAVKVAMEAHRRAKPYCMGTLFWQLNDCWPVVSWSSIDYYGRWKALQHYSRRAYSPVMASPYMNGDTVSVKVISDLTREFTGTLEVLVMDFEGNVLWDRTVGCRLESDGVKDMISIDSELLEGNRFLYVRLLEEGNEVSENTFWTRFPNDYEYGEPKVRIEVKERAEGLELTVSSDRLARGLYLYTDNDNDIFEDNYMDLVPGFARRITVRTDSTAEEFKTTLKYQTL